MTSGWRRPITRDGRKDSIHVFAGREHDIGRLVLFPGTCFRGRTVDSQGQPLAGAKIEIADFRYVLGHTVTSDQTEWTLTSDAQGRFTTALVPPGDVQFQISSPGKVRTFVRRPAEPGTPLAALGDVALADDVPIQGTVVNRDGKPAPGVNVMADYNYHDGVTTDKDGHFTIRASGKDAKQLILRSIHYFAPNPFDLGAKRQSLTLTVSKAYEVNGLAVDAETGKPVPIQTVQLCIVMRDPDGSYTLLG